MEKTLVYVAHHVLTRAGTKKKWKIESREVAGRTEGLLRFEDTSISESHCAFHPHSLALEVQDLGSSTGTWVNEVKISGAALLVPGDVIQIGSVVLIYSQTKEKRVVRRKAEDAKLWITNLAFTASSFAIVFLFFNRILTSGDLAGDNQFLAPLLITPGPKHLITIMMMLFMTHFIPYSLNRFYWTDEKFQDSGALLRFLMAPAAFGLGFAGLLILMTLWSPKMKQVKEYDLARQSFQSSDFTNLQPEKWKRYSEISSEFYKLKKYDPQISKAITEDLKVAQRKTPTLSPGFPDAVEKYFSPFDVHWSTETGTNEIAMKRYKRAMNLMKSKRYKYALDEFRRLQSEFEDYKDTNVKIEELEKMIADGKE